MRIPQPTVKHKGLIYQISPLMTVIDELGLVCKYSKLYIKVSATGGWVAMDAEVPGIENAATGNPCRAEVPSNVML
jgi:hypothetical protein